MKTIYVFFIIIQFFLSMTFSVYALEQSQMLKIGLFYGTTALKNINFENQIGYGYKIGFLEKNKFVSLYSVEEKKIIVKNIYNYENKLAFQLELQKNFITENEAIEYKNHILNLNKEINVFICFNNGQYKIRINHYLNNINLEKEKNDIAKSINENEIQIIQLMSSYIIISNKNEKILFEVNSNEIIILPISENNEKSTWIKGYSYSGDFICTQDNNGKFTVINYIEMQNYLKGVVPYEMNPLWHIEALKAQAICARSYAYNNRNKHKKYGFDLCNSIDCQVYNGYKSFEKSDKAVEETNDMFIMYNGIVATGFFHSSNGGATEDSENVWNIYVPYLRGVIDTNENIEKTKNYKWQIKISKQIICNILNSKGYLIKNLIDIYIDKYTKLDNVFRLIIIYDDNKKMIFEREKVRTILNSIKYNISINSMRYKLEKTISNNDLKLPYYINETKVLRINDEIHVIGKNSQIKKITDIIGKNIICKNNQIINIKNTNDEFYTIIGSGWGHNVGMSQYGAKSLAENGTKYNEIIKFYFNNTYISK